MEFVIKGNFKKGDNIQVFSKKIEAPSKNAAIQKISTKIGSIYRCKKNKICIESAEEIK